MGPEIPFSIKAAVAAALLFSMSVLHTAVYHEDIGSYVAVRLSHLIKGDCDKQCWKALSRPPSP